MPSFITVIIDTRRERIAHSNVVGTNIQTHTASACIARVFVATSGTAAGGKNKTGTVNLHPIYSLINNPLRAIAIAMLLLPLLHDDDDDDGGGQANGWRLFHPFST